MIHHIKGFLSPSQVMATEMPSQSVLAVKLQSCTFHDSYATPDPFPDWPLTRVWHRALSQTPAWVHRLMALRNAIAAPFGLKTGAGLNVRRVSPSHDPSDDWRVGDQTGLFVLRTLAEHELVAGLDDKHLNFDLSLLREWREGVPWLVLSTVVFEHNLLGRSYMKVITPFHRIICKTLLARIHTPK